MFEFSDTDSFYPTNIKIEPKSDSCCMDKRTDATYTDLSHSPYHINPVLLANIKEDTSGKLLYRLLVCLFVYLFICLFVYLFIDLFVCLFVCLFIYLVISFLLLLISLLFIFDLFIDYSIIFLFS